MAPVIVPPAVGRAATSEALNTTVPVEPFTLSTAPAPGNVCPAANVIAPLIVPPVVARAPTSEATRTAVPVFPFTESTGKSMLVIPEPSPSKVAAFTVPETVTP